MKIEFTKGWCLRMAQLEAETASNFEIGAASPTPAGQVAQVVRIDEPLVEASSPFNVVFGRFVRLMRRHKHLSLEKLADDARVDITELVEIEEDSRHTPDPRTVYQLATVFEVPMPKMMQLAGLSKPKDARLVDEAIRFAARSESVEELNSVERAALEAFVAVLSDRN
jgi:transcriptional regulator with XRE-family HTH domain